MGKPVYSSNPEDMHSLYYSLGYAPGGYVGEDLSRVHAAEQLARIQVGLESVEMDLDFLTEPFWQDDAISEQSGRLSEVYEEKGEY